MDPMGNHVFNHDIFLNVALQCSLHLFIGHVSGTCLPSALLAAALGVVALMAVAVGRCVLHGMKTCGASMRFPRFWNSSDGCTRILSENWYYHQVCMDPVYQVRLSEHSPNPMTDHHFGNKKIIIFFSIISTCGHSHFHMFCNLVNSRRCARLHPHFGLFWMVESIPIGSMYAIYGDIYHQYTHNVSIYTIHGSYGI